MDTADFDIMDALLVKYIQGNISSEEKTEVNEWLLQDTANQKYLNDFKYIWENSQNLQNRKKPNEAEAWIRFQERIQNNNTETETVFKNNRFPWTRVAAIFAIVLGLTFVAIYLYQEKYKEVVIVATNDVLQKSLPDGTIVTLNKNSSICYKNSFKKTDRSVTLSGEAFFNVTPDKQNPFTISAQNNIAVKVVGTSFNVISNDDSTNVIVKTGIVKVKDNNNEITLYPNESVTISKSNTTLEKRANSDQLYAYYKTKEFVCNKTPLAVLVKKLNEVYQSNIVIENPTIAQLELTTAFSNESLDDILNVISKTFKLKIDKSDNRILIK